MGLKILHSADWHLDSPFASCTPEQRRFLKQAQQALPGKIAAIAREEGCELMVLSGDIFDGRPSRETVQRVKTALGSCGIPVVIAPGNHDFCGPGSPWLEEHWPEDVYIFKGGLEAVDIPSLNCRVYGAGYTSMDCPPLLEGFRAEGETRWCIAVLHGDPTVVKSPCCPVTAAQVRDSGLDYLALGHIHKSGSFRAGATLCGWPGCPMGRGWDETGEKGLYIVTLEESASLRWVPLDTPRFYGLETDGPLEALLPAAGGEDLYRVTLTGEGPVDLEELKKAFSRFPNLELIDQTREAAPLWEWAQGDTLRGVYFRLLREEGSSLAEQTARLSRDLLEGREGKLL